LTLSDWTRERGQDVCLQLAGMKTRREDLFAIFSQFLRLTGIISPAYHAVTVLGFSMMGSLETVEATMSYTSQPINIFGLVLISLPVGSVWCCGGQRLNRA
jgi:hypothetical protein